MHKDVEVNFFAVLINVFSMRLHSYFTNSISLGRHFFVKNGSSGL